MSEVIQVVLEIAQGNLYKIRSQRLNKSLSLTLISEHKEFLKTQSCKMKQKCEKSTSNKVKAGPNKISIRNDLAKDGMIFSEESSRAIYEMGIVEVIVLKQTSETTQCASCLKHLFEGMTMCQCGKWLRPIEVRWTEFEQHSKH